MSQSVVSGLIRQLEKLSEEERDRLRKLPRLTPEEQERARDALRRGVRGGSIPNPEDDGKGGGLDGWESEALERCSSGEIMEYILSRNRILGLGQHTPGAWDEALRLRRARSGGTRPE